MDAQDIRIFCALAISGLPEAIPSSVPASLRRVARGLRLDEKTVRVRLRRMESAGFIKYYQVAPDLTLLGMNAELTCRFEAVNVSTKLAALGVARTMPGMVEALDFLGPSFVVTLVGSELDNAREALRHLAHRFELERYEQGHCSLDRSGARLAPLDWRIVERMRYDARAPLGEVARGLQITPRTVRYRLHRMQESGAVSIRPMIDARQLRNIILYRLAVVVDRVRQGEILALLQRRFGSKLWALRVSLAGPILLDLFGHSIGEPEEAAVRCLEVPGVDSCRVLILKEVLEPVQRSWIDRRVSDLAAGRGPPVEGEPGD